MAEIKFRAIERDDLDLIKMWRNSPNVMPYCRQYRPLSNKDMSTWYESMNRESDYNLTNDMFMILDGEMPIGVCGLIRIDWRNRKAEVSFYIGTPQEASESTIIKSLCKLMVYAFKTLGLHKVYFPVYSYNPYLTIYEKCMTRGYVAKGEYFYDGVYHDRIVLEGFDNE